MTITEQFICGKHTAADSTMDHFCQGITHRIAEEYAGRGIADFVATKGLVEGNASFDDRAYVSLNIL